MARQGRRHQHDRREPPAARGARANDAPLAVRRGAEAGLPAARLLQGADRQLRRDRPPGRRRAAHAGAGHRPGAPPPRPRLRPAVGEGRGAHRPRHVSVRKETRNRMENVNLDLVQLIQQGAISTYPLLACSIVVFGIVLERLWSLRGTVSSTLSLTAQVVPVLGIIRAFHHMAIAGTGGFAVVAGGISEALIATALGLAVGIIAVVCYNYFQARVERIDAALRIGSARVLEAVASSRRTNGV